MPRHLLLARIVVLSLTILGLGPHVTAQDAALTLTTAPLPVEHLVPQVISVRPHAQDSYTQGLLLADDKIYESAGQYGESDLRLVDPETGEVLRKIEFPPNYFAEGLALVDTRLIQITWKEQIAFIFDQETFEPLGYYTYEGEGWGLCYDGETLWMSDGSAFLDARSPETFISHYLVPVTYEGVPLSEAAALQPGLSPELNELECVGDSIYANVYMTDTILRIDKASGQVTGFINAAGLLTPEELALLAHGEVLNGIAYVPEQDTFLITGKRWPKLFEVRFVSSETLEAGGS
jgi:glutaminyl-peptide cyclotransferase